MGRMITVSSSEGRVAEWHDTITADGRRLTGAPRNADVSLSDRNEHWYGEYRSDRDKFNAIFQPSVDDFNSRQNRPSKKMGPESTKAERQKTYYDGIVDGTFCNGHANGDGTSTKEQAVYEVVLQIGDKDTNGTTDRSFDIKKWYGLKTSGKEEEASAYALEHLNDSEDAERTKRILRRAADRILKLDPEHLIVLRMDFHGDEPCGTPNVHIAFSFRATGYKSGMKERTASVRALEQMGFRKSKEKGYGIEQLHERFKEIVAEEMAADALEYGYEPFERAPDSGEHRQRSEVDVFREMAAEREELGKKKKEADETLYAAKRDLDSAKKKVLEAESKAAWIVKEAERQAEKTAAEKAPALIQEAIQNRVKTVDGLLEIMKQDAEAETEKIVSDAKAEAKAQAKAEADRVIAEAKTTAREEARKITEAADAAAKVKAVDAQAKADKMQADAQAVADKIEEDAKTAAAQRAQDAEVEYRRRVKVADEEAEKIQAEKQAALEQEKRKFDEDRQVYLARLREQAQRVHEKSGAEEDLLPEGAGEQAVQDRMFADYQKWEDAIEAQKKALTEAQAQAETEKRAYETARRSYEKEAADIQEEKQGVWGTVMDFLAMVQTESTSETIQKMAGYLRGHLKNASENWNTKFAEWRARKLAQRRSRVDGIESELYGSLRNDREYK